MSALGAIGHEEGLKPAFHMESCQELLVGESLKSFYDSET